ncbi:LysM peptidoglycan-binding domain-containing protein [Pimelobacter simplex]|uniref:LysM peptidoglycan-binding domain-containing protein n=1 Tax=Nocardioides simplex TaxID=2045 RepID=UPI00382605EF
MELASSPAARRRAALLWLGVSAAAVLAGLTLGPGALRLVRAPGTTFAELLVQCCTTAALVAVAGLWLAATDVARAVVLRRPGRVGPVRATLLALCGITALAASAAPAGAADPPPAVPAPAPAPVPSLAGLPLPDRPTGTRSAPDRLDVVVRPGDTLWAIAERALGPGATAGEVAAHWPRIHARNAAVIGPDPDRIRPGQLLHLPSPPPPLPPSPLP